MEKQISAVSKWRKLLNYQGMKPLTESKKKITAKMIENIYLRSKGLLKEDKLTTADIEGFTTILIPMIRRMAPELIALDIIGSQAMDKPSQYIFALRAFYSGALNASGVNKTIAAGWQGNTTKACKIGMFGSVVNAASEINILKAVAPTWTTDTFATLGGVSASGSTYGVLDVPTAVYPVTVVFDVDGTTVLSATRGNTIGNVNYAENEGYIIALASNKDVNAGDYLTFDSQANINSAIVIDPSLDGLAALVVEVKKAIKNEVMYNHIMTHYSGAYTTAEMEAMKSFNEISFDVSRTTVDAKGRLLKARYSFEVAEDLKAYHGLEAETELMNMITYEILAEMNKEVRDQIITAATDSANQVFNFDYATLPVDEGRWHQEKFRMLYNLINRVASTIAISTRRGPANWLITTLPVKNALESMDGTSLWTDVNNNFNTNAAVVYTGTLAGKYKVFIDTFATSDYVALGYKGETEYDAGLFYCPYVPLTAVKAVDQDNFQPRLGFRTRYGIGSNPLGANLYYRYVNIENLDNAFGTTFDIV